MCRKEHNYHLFNQRVVCCACACAAFRYYQSQSELTGGLILQVQHIVPEVTIPPEVTPENVTTYIVDTGGKV